MQAHSTGIGFFKPAEADLENSAMLNESALETNVVDFDKPVDYDKDVHIDLERTAS